VDTANDFRLLVAEDAVARLERRIRQWGMPWPVNKSKALELVERARKALLRLKYSFLPSEMILESEELKTIVDSAVQLRGLIFPEVMPKLEGSRRMALAEIRYSLIILLGLPNRIRLGEDNHPEWAIDVVGVKVTRVEELRGASNLYYTRAAAGNIAFTIVTNLREIREGEVRAAAILPPVEFHGVISEAMYASEPLEEKYLGKRVPRRLLSPEVKAQVIRLVSGK